MNGTYTTVLSNIGRQGNVPSVLFLLYSYRLLCLFSLGFSLTLTVVILYEEYLSINELQTCLKAADPYFVLAVKVFREKNQN